MLDPAPEDRELMRRAAAGDRAAFVTVAQRHAPAVLRLCTAILGSDADAKDATQETLLAAFRRAPTFRPELGAVRPWLLAIARHEAQRLRRPDAPRDDDPQQPLERLGLDAGWSAADPEALLSRAEDAEALAWAIAALAPRDREVLVLRDIEGQSGEHTAELLGLDLAGMKSRLHRARLKLMAALREGRAVMAEQERIEGGLRCGEVLARLSDYVDGELEPEVRGQIDRHLERCTVCERFGGRFKRTVAALRTRLATAPAVDAKTFEAVLSRLLPVPR